jgi:hypothetical protein
MNILASIGNTFNTISNGTEIGKLAVAASAILVAYISPIVGLLVACFACSITDMIYGIKVTKRLGKKITSKKNWKGTLTKIKDEFALILLAHLLEYVIGYGDNFILSGGIAVIICLTEILSILENLNTLNPEGPWKLISKFLKKKGSDIMDIDDNII